MNPPGAGEKLEREGHRAPPYGQRPSDHRRGVHGRNPTAVGQHHVHLGLSVPIYVSHTPDQVAFDRMVTMQSHLAAWNRGLTIQ